MRRRKNGQSSGGSRQRVCYQRGYPSSFVVRVWNTPLHYLHLHYIIQTVKPNVFISTCRGHQGACCHHVPPAPQSAALLQLHGPTRDHTAQLEITQPSLRLLPHRSQGCAGRMAGCLLAPHTGHTPPHRRPQSIQANKTPTSARSRGMAKFSRHFIGEQYSESFESQGSSSLV